MKIALLLSIYIYSRCMSIPMSQKHGKKKLTVFSKDSRKNLRCTNTSLVDIFRARRCKNNVIVNTRVVSSEPK